MNNYDQRQAQGAYPAPAVEGYGQPVGGCMVPPPAGYPMKDGHQGYSATTGPARVETQARGDGFWKGCCAALCCCCLLDACF